MTAQAGAVAACSECGMPCAATDYHPYAACMMFKACQNSEVVRRNIAAIRGVPVEALEGLLDKAQFLVDGLDEEYVAWPTRVLMLRAELTKLTQLIKERSNG